ncbi:MAG: HD-GYP domain-containing protein [Candidatus Krumholzibacteriia bacterium]
MAIQFQSLAMADKMVFGVKLLGTVGRGDKSHLKDLASKCLAKGKVHIVMDLSEVGALGGGGAAILAGFQQQLVDAGGEAVFAGPNEVVRKFLAGRFTGLPLRCFATADEAEAAFFGAARENDPETMDFAEAVNEPVMMDEPEAGGSGSDDSGSRANLPESDAEELEELGAMGFFAEEFEVDDQEQEVTDFSGPAETRADEEGPAPSAPAAQGPGTGSGRRREHSYTSLSEAITTLGGWANADEDGRFGQALQNLLFSHGLAEEVTLLVARDGQFTSEDGAWKFESAGALARQLDERGHPLTLLDIQDDDLTDIERLLLEETNPDILLPVKVESRLVAILLLKRTAGGDEYSVVEHFALELLMRVLSGEDLGGAGRKSDTGAGSAETERSPEDEPTPAWQESESRDESVAEALLRLALDLPDADDRMHFWRIFGRNLWPVLPIRSMGYLAPDSKRPQVVIAQNDPLLALDLGNKRLKVYFRTIERPVAVHNIPNFFKDVRDDLEKAGIDWVVSLRWDEEYQGTALVSLSEDIDSLGLGDLIHELFSETSRLLSRFEDSHENADVNLELVRILMGQWEKRMFGTDDMTRAMVSHVNRLARAMGFTLDQERELIYGCLLRDVGLIDKEDALMGSPERMDPVQWSLYRRHPEEGARLLETLNLPQSIVDVVRCHHERFGGEGFPMGLAGREIPLAARVVTVVESYVAMVIGTDEREPVSAADASRILRDNLGGRYDPDIVNLFLRAIQQEKGRIPGSPARQRPTTQVV